MEDGGFSVSHRDDDGTRYLVLSGELDIAHAEWVREALRLGDEVAQVVIDTTELTFIDSTGLGALVVGCQQLGEGRFELVPGKATTRILHLTGMSEFFGLIENHSDGHRRPGASPIPRRHRLSS